MHHPCDRRSIQGTNEVELISTTMNRDGEKISSQSDPREGRTKKSLELSDRHSTELYEEGQKAAAKDTKQSTNGEADGCGVSERQHDGSSAATSSEECGSWSRKAAVVRAQHELPDVESGGRSDVKVARKLTLSAFRKPEFAVRLTSSPPDKLLHQHYDLTSSSRVLGHGASSTVRLAKHKLSGRKVAVKSIGKHDVLTRCAHAKRHKGSLDECDVLLSLKGSHESIISLLDVYETDSEVQLVLEYCAGGELFDAIQRRRHCGHDSVHDDSSADNHAHSLRRKRPRPVHSPVSYAKPLCSGYTEAQVARISYQLISALTHMHRRGIVHRDVKPENIFLVSEHDEDDMTVKLSDFGLARVIPTAVANKPAGTSASKSTLSSNSTSTHKQTNETTNNTPLTPPTEQHRLQSGYGQIASDYYAAPEVTNGYKYTTAVDVYSLGVTLYILLSGFPPAARPRCGSMVLDNDTSSSEDDSDDDHHTSHHHHSRLNNASSFEFPNRHWRHITPSAKNLVRRMLHPDPKRRITAQHALQHEWIILHLQALRIKALASPFSSCEIPCSSNLISSTSSRSSSSAAAASNIPIVSFSSVQFDYLASKLFESKKRKLRSSTTCHSTEERNTTHRRKSHRRTYISSKTKTLNHKEPRLAVSSSNNTVVSSLPLSMADLYSQVSSVAAAATAAAEELLDNISESYDATGISGKLEIGEENKERTSNSSSSQQQENVCFSNSMTPLSV